MIDDPADREEIQESIHYGVDTYSHTENRQDAFFRSKRKPLVAIKVFDAKYRLAFKGRAGNKYFSDEKTGQPFLIEKEIGFRPILARSFVSENQIGFFKTPTATLDCQETVFEKLDQWLAMRTIELLGPRSNFSSKSELIDTILPLIVERNKPRLCIGFSFSHLKF